MNHRKTLIAATFAAAATFASLLPAQYIEDRDNRNPTGATWFPNVSAAYVALQVSKGNRIVDLEVARVSPSLRFTVSMVPNAGKFKKTWWYYYGQTAASVWNLVTTLQARLTDIEVYNTSSGLRFAVLLEANSTNGKAWWYYIHTSIARISQTASQNGARVVDLEQYRIGTRTYYSAILLKNSGPDAKPWWWYLNVTASSVNSLLATNNARIWDLNRLSNGRYNVVMVKFSGEYEWHFFGRTSSQVHSALSQYGARLIDVEQYSTFFGTRYDIVLANASNRTSSRTRDVMHKKSDGTMGTYLRRVPLTGSSYNLAYINAGTRFEPASTLKMLHHVHTMRRVYTSSSWYLSKPISVRYKSPPSCPTSTSTYSLPLRKVLEDMMRASDNALTRTITELWGMPALNSTAAAALGMSNTRVNHHIGCGTPANYTTLVDLGKLHERVIKGYLGAQRQNFYSIMVNDFYGGGYAEGYLKQVIDQEAIKAGLSAAQRNSFVNAMQVTGKKGGYGVGNPLRYHRAWGAYAKIPFWTNGGVTYREYVTGAFVNFATNETKAIDAAAAGASEVLRDEIAAAMRSLKNHVFGSFTSFGASCGGRFSPYQHTGVGMPEIGQRISYRATASGRRGTTLASLEIGSSRSRWNGTPLPLSLAFLGANGCYWRTNSLINVSLTANNGSVGLNNLLIPVDKNLIGVSFYTQFLISDPGANAANLTATNGIRTSVGGQK